MSGTITLEKNQDVLGYIIVLFSVLDKKAFDKDISFEGNKIFIRKKDDSEITKLNVDAEALKAKIFKFIDLRAAAYCNLTEEETVIFKLISDAAYYFITEQPTQSTGEQRFVKIYEEFYKGGK